MSKKELNNRARELKNIAALTKNVNKQIPGDALSRAELRNIKRANTIPRGNKRISNVANNIIDVLNVSKTYVFGNKKFNALNGVNFGIKRGDFVVILGPSGSGKTSLLNVISGLDRATTGDVIVEGVNLSALTNRELTTFRRNKIAFIFQSYNLLPELNARDNAELGRALQIDGTKRTQIDEIFANLGIANKLNSPINNLSGGEAQRVSVARALAKRPAIIFADEPTGALDSESSMQVLALFQKINQQGTTIVVVTHNRDLVNYASCVINVKDGKVQYAQQNSRKTGP